MPQPQRTSESNSSMSLIRYVIHSRIYQFHFHFSIFICITISQSLLIMRNVTFLILLTTEMTLQLLYKIQINIS